MLNFAPRDAIIRVMVQAGYKLSRLPFNENEAVNILLPLDA